MFVSKKKLYQGENIFQNLFSKLLLNNSIYLICISLAFATSVEILLVLSAIKFCNICAMHVGDFDLLLDEKLDKCWLFHFEVLDVSFFVMLRVVHSKDRCFPLCTAMTSIIFSFSRNFIPRKLKINNIFFFFFNSHLKINSHTCNAFLEVKFKLFEEKKKHYFDDLFLRHHVLSCIHWQQVWCICGVAIDTKKSPAWTPLDLLRVCRRSFTQKKKKKNVKLVTNALFINEIVFSMNELESLFGIKRRKKKRKKEEEQEQEEKKDNRDDNVGKQETTHLNCATWMNACTSFLKESQCDAFQKSMARLILLLWIVCALLFNYTKKED